MKKLELSEIKEVILESLDIFSNEEKIKYFDSMRKYFGFNSDSSCLDHLVFCHKFFDDFSRCELSNVIKKGLEAVRSANFDWAQINKIEQ